MDVYVLGAGASYHAGYPLARDLGAAVARWLRTAQPSESIPEWRLSQYRTYLGDLAGLNDCEAWLTSLQEETGDPSTEVRTLASTTIDLFPSAIADYFDDIRGSAAPLYDRLAEQVHPGDVIVTFNYDLALECALRKHGRWDISHGYGFQILDEGTSQTLVLKLHGSTNWVHCFGLGGVLSKGDPSGGRPVVMPQDWRFLGYSGDDPGWRAGGVARRMILPAHNKFFDERFWNELWKQADRALGEASRVTIIGYSIPAADRRANDLLFGGGEFKGVKPRTPVRISCRTDGSRLCGLFSSRGYPTEDLYSFEDLLHR